MSRWLPCKRYEFIRRVRKLGFQGPFFRHKALIYGIPGPSNREYSVPQLKMMLKKVEEILGRGITLEEWDSLSK